MSVVKPPTRRARRDGLSISDAEPESISKPSESALPPLQAGNGMNLRGKRDSHPAAPDMSAPKRSTEEVQAEKRAKEQARLAKAAARQSAVNKAAEVEDRLRMSEQQAKETGHNPPTTTKTKKPRQKKKDPKDTEQAAEESEQLAGDRDSKAKNTSTTAQTPQTKRKRTAPATSTARTSASLSSPTTTSTTPNKSPSQCDIEDLEDDEQAAEGLDDSGYEAKPVKKKKKGELRAEVGQKRVSTASEASVTVTEPPKKKKKLILQGFKSSTNTVSNDTLNNITTSSIFGGDISNQAATTITQPDGAEYVSGGFGDEIEGHDERETTVKSGSKPLKMKTVSAVVPQSTIVKIEPTTSVQGLVTPARKRKQVRLADLPGPVKTAFSKTFMPVIIEYTGCITAWTGPNVDDLAELWASVMSETLLHQFAELNKDQTIKTLVDQQLSSWRNTFAKTALAALEEVFKRQHLESPDERKAYIAHQLEGNYKCRSFYYLNVMKKDGKTYYGGPFQSYLIAKTLSEHLKSIKTIAKEDRLDMRPVGAIVLSIQAVQRALTFNESGVRIIPHGQDRYFSQQVWGDRFVNLDGKKVHQKTTSQLHWIFGENPSTNTARVSSAQWDQIIEAAQACTTVKNVSKPATTSPTEEPIDSDEDWTMPDEDPDFFREHTNRDGKGGGPQETETKDIGEETTKTVTAASAVDKDESAGNDVSETTKTAAAASAVGEDEDADDVSESEVVDDGVNDADSTSSEDDEEMEEEVGTASVE
ncbi:hypothetical protein D9758_005471 [Tetrapyrgos nigripes]|uniref:Uncharacterized protein n=1 Tax=Tetrapyrgos nigripes TaxID=182062 RepID=A0A8H5GHX6_9AGAR|nr:hypothetical protein D9758_005471 [Tetrapyrgos nigripes]